MTSEIGGEPPSTTRRSRCVEGASARARPRRFTRAACCRLRPRLQAQISIGVCTPRSRSEPFARASAGGLRRRHRTANPHPPVTIAGGFFNAIGQEAKQCQVDVREREPQIERTAVVEPHRSRISRAALPEARSLCPLCTKRPCWRFSTPSR